MSDAILLEIMSKLGELAADMRNLKDDQTADRRVNADFRKEVRDEMSEVKAGVSEVGHAIRPVAETVKKHEKRLDEHAGEIATNRTFRDRFGAVTAVGGAGFSLVFGGVVWLITTYWHELLAVLRGLFARS
ncbi:hypothetical protein NVS89_22385 [Ancylobacter sp. MQZ15Z-1]|uniref:DUF1515 domain-containing protein n=1 Tax=Ancylobacter mangrovi TaxID=2972472 RepID=A0A9X2T949_9HYPH|nr:hypothetical protein [Ancylobacter mangrovi]MCS0497843.1 hypothetical protein [Ancylobacter mangrovi]